MISFIKHGIKHTLNIFFKVYDNLHLLPVDNTARYIGKEKRKREYQRQQKQTIEYKKRRSELKSSKTQHV